MAKIPVIVRFNTALAARTNNKVLKTGEWGYESDTGLVKIGRGLTWNSTPYAGKYQGRWVAGVIVDPDTLWEYQNKLYRSTRSETFTSNTNPVASGNTYFELVGGSEVTSSAVLGAIGDGSKISPQYLPSYVDDVLDGAYVSATVFNDSNGNAYTPESGKIYSDITSNLTYRWSGTAYVRLDAGVVLGETSTTAGRGDYTKIAYDHSQTTGNPHGTNKSDIGLGNVDNTSDLDKPISNAQGAVNSGFSNRLDDIEASYEKVAILTYSGGSKTFTFPNGDLPDSVFVLVQKSDDPAYINVIPTITFTPNASSFTIVDENIPIGTVLRVAYRKGTVPVNPTYITSTEFSDFLSLYDQDVQLARLIGSFNFL